jgi:hypothetical protein
MNASRFVTATSIAAALTGGGSMIGCSLNQFRGPRQLEVDTCEDKALIDDAEDGDDQILLREGRGGYFYTFADKAGSTVLPGENAFAPEAGGPGGSTHAIHVTGRLARSGEVYVGTGFDFKQASDPYDASRFTGLSFAARVKTGSEPHVRLLIADVNTDPKGKICKACDNDFGVAFKPADQWARYEVAFSELKQEVGWGSPRPPAVDPSKLMGVKWQVSVPDANVDLWLDDIGFMGCSARGTANQGASGSSVM